METRTFSELIEDISEVLSEFDGENLARVANYIMSCKVEYLGDSQFEVIYK